MVKSIFAYALILFVPLMLSAQQPAFKDGVMVLEAESFKLVNDATIVSESGASGGKAIKFTGPKGEATLEVTFEPGKYAMTAFENAPDGAHDAFHIGVGEDWVRVFPDTYNTWVELPKACEFEVKAKTKLTVKIVVSWPEIKKKGEDGMLIDKLVIKKK